MTLTETRLLTAADLLRLDSKGVRGELIRGVLCKTPRAGMQHGRIVANVAFGLGSFLKRRRLGTGACGYPGVWLERDPDTVRETDVAFWSVGRMPLGEDVPGYAEIAPDFVAEVASSSDSRRALDDKALMWLSFGVRLVWVVHPESRTVDVHRADGEVSTLGPKDSLDGLDVLPGFTCPVSDIFDA